MTTKCQDGKNHKFTWGRCDKCGANLRDHQKAILAANRVRWAKNKKKQRDRL